MPLPQPFPSCRDCLAAMAGAAADMAAPHDPELRREARFAALRELAAHLPRGLTSPELASAMLRRLRQVTGVDDPYAGFKRQELAASARAMASLQARGGLPQDLAGLVTLAVLGNSLDFFQEPDQAMAEALDALEQGISFHHNDLARLEAALERGVELMLYLTDNAGEIHFDLPLFRHLRRRVGRVVLVVKGGPAQNDLTRADLELSGLAGEFGPDEVADTGCDGAGVDWGHISPQFTALFNQADLVLAKGMANFETMYRQGLPTDTLFLFKAKCEALQEYLKAPPHSYWALWQEAEA